MYNPVDLDFFDHPKVERLSKLCHKKSEVCALKVIKFWLYCAKFYQSGDVTLIKESQNELKKAFGMQGQKALDFFNHMVTVGFIDYDDDDEDKSLIIHHWFEHGFGLIQDKIKQRKDRKKRYADKKKEDDGTSGDNGDGRSDITKPNKTKQKGSPIPPLGDDIPERLKAP